MSVIEDIFRGNCYPTERVIPEGQEYIAASTQQRLLQEQLIHTLSVPERELLERYINAKEDEAFYLELEYFRKGMRFGAQVQRELDL